MRLRWTVKLSELEIDTSKDWRGYVIKNLGAPTDPYDSARKIDLDNLQISWDRITDKPEKYPPESHGSSHGADPNYPASGASDPITGWIYPSHIGPRSTDYTTPVRMWFWTRDYTGQNTLNNILSPMDSGVGRLGDSSYPWGETWTRSLYTDNIRPVASGSGGNIGASDNYYYSAYIYNIYTRYIDCGTPISGIPSSRVDADYIYNKSGDGYGYLGSSTRRWGYAYIVNLYVNYLNGWNPDAHASRHEYGGADPVRNLDYLAIRGTTVISSGRVLQNIASVGQSLTPSTDNTYDLGSSSYRWRNLYLSGPANVGSLQIAGTTVIGSDRKLQNIASVAQDLYPSADATYLIGSSSYRWYGVNAVNVNTTYLNGWNPDAHASRHEYGGADPVRNLDCLMIRGTMVITSDRVLQNIASVGQSLYPSIDAQLLLGSSSYRWYAVNAVNVNTTYLNGWNPNAHASRHLSGGADAITGWISPSHIGPRSDSAADTIFRTRNIADTLNVDHRFRPSTDNYGYLGTDSYRWWSIYSNYANHWILRMRSTAEIWLPYDTGIHAYLEPASDGYSYVGSSIYRFYMVRAVNIVSGDLGFEDMQCLVCGKPFKENDSIVLKVRKVDKDNRQILVVPVHSECNPHELNPEMMKIHEEMLKPNRGNLPDEYRPKATPPGNPEPLKEGEFEVISVTPENENTAMFNIIMWDGTRFSIPLPPDISEEELATKVHEYYNMIKEKERIEAELREKAKKKLKRDWSGYKGKIPAGKPS
jgi:hypothetical protein